VVAEDVHFLDSDDEGSQGKDDQTAAKKGGKKKRKKKHMTGVITSKEGIERLQKLVTQGMLKADDAVEPVSFDTPQGPTIVVVETEESQREVLDLEGQPHCQVC